MIALVSRELRAPVHQIPGLSAFIRDTVHSVLGPMMYEPNFYTLNLEQMLSGNSGQRGWVVYVHWIFWRAIAIDC